MGFLAEYPQNQNELAQENLTMTIGSTEISSKSNSSSTLKSGSSTKINRLKSSVKFKIHYQAKYGQSIYLIGSIKILGQWKIEKSLRMQWTQGDYWIASLSSIDLDYEDLDQFVEYKYCLGNTLNPEQNQMLWEDGINRTFQLPQVSQICLNDVWSHRKVILRLFETKSINDLYVLGDCEEIGTYESPQKMERVVQTNFADCSQTVYYEKAILIQAHKQKIKYSYAKKDTNQMLIIDRKPRRLQIKRISKKAIFQLRIFNENILFIQQKIHFEINDNYFSSKFQIIKIDENIYLGPYPQSEDDIKELNQRGIKAVLNLQTEKDMSLKGVAYIKLLQFYKTYKIQPFHFPIIDMDVIDMCYKLQDVSRLLNFLINTLKKVYVHCTAGMFRSPQCVIGYFTYFRNMQISQAIKFVQQQHPNSKINKSYIEMVMNSTPISTYCSMNDIDIKYQKQHISDSDFFNDDDEENNDINHNFGDLYKKNLDFSYIRKFN